MGTITLRFRKSTIPFKVYTSKSRLAVDREFMYIGSAGPGRADGRTADGRTATAGRAARRTAGGRDDFERQYNDFHYFSQTSAKNIMFFCRFASGGRASTDFYSSNEKGVQKMTKKHFVFLTFQITRERKYRFLHLK